jgi:hypothetical protein
MISWWKETSKLLNLQNVKNKQYIPLYISDFSKKRKKLIKQSLPVCAKFHSPAWPAVPGNQKLNEVLWKRVSVFITGWIITLVQKIYDNI